MSDTAFTGDLKKLIEAIIFAADHPVTADKIQSVVEDVEREDIEKALEELAQDYDDSRGIQIALIGKGYQLKTRAEHAPWIKKFFKVGLQRISKAAMEAAAIVAYKQPVTRGELEEIRGVDSGGVLKTLLDRRLIKITGKKDVPGRPVVYGTTSEFLEVFDLSSLADLPTLRDIEVLAEEAEEEAFQQGLFQTRRGEMLSEEEVAAERELEKALEKEEESARKLKEAEEKFKGDGEEGEGDDDGEFDEEEFDKMMEETKETDVISDSESDNDDEEDDEEPEDDYEEEDEYDDDEEDSDDDDPEDDDK